MICIENRNGLYYFPNVFDGEVITSLDEKEWIPLSKNKNSRLVQHYGYTYDYTSKNIYTKCEEIPPFLEKYRNFLMEVCKENSLLSSDDYEFNQCIINNYYPGQGINPHTDNLNYGEAIGCFSVGSGTIMTFSRDEEKKDIYIEENSLYVMTLQSRYSYTHCMPGRKSDLFEGNVIPRKRRISITFRNVK